MMPIQAQRQGVDREIAAVQVEFDAAALDGRQGGGVGIELRAGRNQVDEWQAGYAGQAASDLPVPAGTTWQCRTGYGWSLYRRSVPPGARARLMASPSTTRSKSWLGRSNSKSRTKPPTIYKATCCSKAAWAMMRSSARCFWQQGCLQARRQVHAPRQARLGCQGFQQIGAGDDPNNIAAARVHHRDLPPAAVGHQAHQLLDRVAGMDGMRAASITVPAVGA